MRINLNVKYEEKDQAKSLGAWWDPGRKTWFIKDVEDLTPFMRWIPQVEPPSRAKKFRKHMQDVHKKAKKPRTTVSKVAVEDCGCRQPPWEHCEHSLARLDPELDDDQREHLRSILSI